MSIITVSVVQFCYKPISSFDDFITNVEKLLDQAEEADFVVFPETFTLELQYLLPDNNISKIPQFTEEYKKLFSRLTKERDQYLVAGSHLIIEDGKEYNIGHIFCPDGNVFTHRKTHLFPLEGQLGVTPGVILEIFETPKAKVALGYVMKWNFQK